MKRVCVVLLLAFSAVVCFSQENVSSATKTYQQKSNAALNMGVLMGGGGLLGADLEFLFSPEFGIQIGGGLGGSFAVGVNYHIKPKINSSYVSIQYWQQGFGDNLYASYLGPMFVFRTRKIFQAGLGIGCIIKEGPKFSFIPEFNLALMCNVGIYFPL